MVNLLLGYTTFSARAKYCLQIVAQLGDKRSKCQALTIKDTASVTRGHVVWQVP